MKFVFICPKTNKVFESDEFRIIEDRGITLDKFGNKIWDAKVELYSACPFCGKRHLFHVKDLTCPFTPLESSVR
nr:hypothetical protein [Desulfobacterales bacterium]